VLVTFSPQAGRRKHHQFEPEGMRDEVVEREDALAFLGAQVADGEQAREATPGGAVARIGEDVRRAVGKDKPRARMVAQRQVLLALGQMRAHHAGHRIAVAESEPGEPHMLRLQHQFLRVRGPAQEGEVRGDGEFEVWGLLSHW
jgi:hypothetical protein